VSEQNISENNIRITGPDALHITKSLRMAKGEKVTVCDMKSTEYECIVADFENGDVVLDIVSKSQGKTEPPYKVALYQALPKSDKMETIIQKSVEAGVYEIIPFISERCISRPDDKGKRSKVERWNKISESAAKQSGRGIIPKVCDILSAKEAFEKASGADISILLYECESTVSLKDIIKDARKDCSISIIIGAEGGFGENEVEAAGALGIKSAGLGPRILRCETAPVVVLGAISYELEL
jgi:16S rRNA (uracil1498-N3)-methyltransferase